MSLARRGEYASAGQLGQESRDRQHAHCPVLHRPGAEINAKGAANHAGLAHQAQQLAVEQQVVPLRLRQVPAQSGGLAGSARAEQQERARRQCETAGIHRQRYNGKNAGELYTDDANAGVIE